VCNLGLATYHVPFPSWSAIIGQVAIFFVIEDAIHYWSHRWLHTPRLYKCVPHRALKGLPLGADLCSFTAPDGSTRCTTSIRLRSA